MAWFNVVALAGSALALVVGLSACGSDEDYSGDIQDVTVAQAASIVKEQEGKATLVVFYRSGCSRSQAFFPTFIDLGQRLASQGASVQAFSFDTDRQEMGAFLHEQGAFFTPYRLLPWQGTELVDAFSSIGVSLGEGVPLPMVIAYKKDGTAVKLWEAARPVDGATIESTVAAEL